MTKYLRLFLIGYECYSSHLEEIKTMMLLKIIAKAVIVPEEWIFIFFLHSGVFWFFVPTIENGEELCIRVCFSCFFFSHAKSATINNHRTGLSDTWYWSPLVVFRATLKNFKIFIFPMSRKNGLKFFVIFRASEQAYISLFMLSLSLKI